MNRRLVALSAVAAMLGGYVIFQGLGRLPREAVMTRQRQLPYPR